MKAKHLFWLLLSLLYFVESCTIYRSTPVSAEKAASDNTKVKIYTKNGSIYRLNKIVAKDGQYYGVKYTHGQTITQPLDISAIETIKVKNKGASTFVTIASCITGIAIVATIILIIKLSSDDWYWDTSSNNQIAM